MRPDFESSQQALGLYYRALAGRAGELVPYDDDADLWQHPDTATTIRLPARAPIAEQREWYQVAVTHRSLHHTLGTFALDLDAPEPLFARRRPVLPPSDAPPLERFARLFGRTALAVEVFAVLEDLRVDAAALRLFAGLAPAYERVRQQALADRPELALLPPRAAVAEALVRLSLGARSVPAPDALLGPLSTVVSVARLLADPRASAESSAEAAIRVYAVLAGLPNVGPIRTARPVSFDSLQSDVDDPRLTAATEELRLEGDEVLDVRLPPVRYRDVPGPRYAGQAASGMPLQEAILRLTPDLSESEDADTDGFTERSLQAERGGVDVTATERPPEPLPHDHGPDLDDHHHAAHGRLHAAGRDEYVYPEWDQPAGHYLPDWCLVRVRRPRPVRSDRRHRRALARHGHLLPGLVSQLERVRPAGRELVPRQPYGDDLDLDACIDALIDLRTGVQPSPNVYAALREQRRDVAVALAVDLSSSTAERLPPDPARPRQVERILDLQRDAVSLLAEALERVGDGYGIYGFSGGGREDVRLSVVKDLDERRSPAIRHRLEGLVPDHTTRMGPAIRHLTARLARSEAATKVLLVVSDGRPYDLDYGQQYGDAGVLDYAVADTARALAEARERGVRPYLVTVDPAGGDYLSEMCDPREYHVITDARDLPKALAQLYVVARSSRATTPRSAPSHGQP
ncbi:MAG TPA: VWA domain-containing protein [Mycobacteriales bacterium]|nr:VWA domain-containing protein [Mycobacteriales bacterium]